MPTSPLSKFTSGEAPVYVWNRNGIPTSKPDMPPSPMIVFSHSTGPRFSHVPLSCVPPEHVHVVRAHGEASNWSVRRPWFIDSSRAGTRESSCWQRARFVALRLRVAHHDETSRKPVRAHDAAVVRLDELERLARHGH